MNFQYESDNDTIRDLMLEETLEDLAFRLFRKREKFMRGIFSEAGSGILQDHKSDCKVQSHRLAKLFFSESEESLKTNMTF